MTYAEHRAKRAYEAFAKKAIDLDDEGLAEHSLKWEELDEGTKECWSAAAGAIWFEVLKDQFPKAE